MTGELTQSQYDTVVEAVRSGLDELQTQIMAVEQAATAAAAREPFLAQVIREVGE